MSTTADFTQKQQQADLDKLEKAIQALNSIIILALKPLPLSEHTYEANEKVLRAMFLLKEEKADLLKRMNCELEGTQQ